MGLKSIVFCLALPISQALAVVSYAEENPLHIRGFASTGVTGGSREDSKVPSMTANNKYRKRPNFQDNTELGLNLSRDLGPDVRFAAQFLVNTGEATTKDAQILDWAFMTYQPLDQISLRMGRQKTPIWMLSDYYDVHKDHPWISVPMEVYGLFQVKVFDGVSATFAKRQGDAAVSLDTFYGTVDLDRILGETVGSVRAPHMYGAGLNLEYDFVKLRGTYVKSSWDLDAAGLVWDARKLDFICAGLNIEKNNFLVMGEYTMMRDLDNDKYQELADRYLAQIKQLQSLPEAQRAQIQQQMGGVSISQLAIAESYTRAKFDKMNGQYITLGYRVADRFLPALTLAQSNTDESQLFYFSNQRTVQLDLGMDVSPNMNIKLEGKQINVYKGHKSQFTFTGPETEDTTVNTYGLQLNATF